MAFIDLHSHSTVSDGTLSPRDVVRLASHRGVPVLALTDHDSVDGIAEAQAAADEAGLRLVPGVEISCDLHGRDVHVLGLFVDPTAPELVALLERAREERVRAADRVLRRLADCRVPVTLEEVMTHAKGQTLGRPHFARALVERGHVRDMDEAFQRFLGEGRPAAVWRDRPPIPEACRAIRAAGGLSILAHPGSYHPTPLGRDVVSQLRLEGLDGVEVHHPSHGALRIQRYTAIAQGLGMVISGGSDFHGQGENDAPGRRGIDAETFAALEARRP